MSNNTGIVLLAAGKSSRMGYPKQLLAFNGSTIIQNAAATALRAGIGPLLIVLGANAGLIAPRIRDLPVVVNPGWEEGMGASVRYGVEVITQQFPILNALILMVCDQPFVTPEILLELVSTHQRTGKPIVCSSYTGTYGPPVLFHRSFFSELMSLGGDTGAKKMINQHEQQMESISFEAGKFDIDTNDEYHALLKRSSVS